MHKFVDHLIKEKYFIHLHQPMKFWSYCGISDSQKLWNM